MIKSATSRKIESDKAEQITRMRDEIRAELEKKLAESATQRQYYSITSTTGGYVTFTATP